MATDKVTIEQFVKTNRIRMTVERIDSNPNMDDAANMDHWKCILSMGRKRMTITFSQGYGHSGAEPETASVLNCLSSDSASFENASSFEDWASDFGYDANSRKAERTFKTIEHLTKRLRNFLGEDLYQQLLWHTESL